MYFRECKHARLRVEGGAEEKERGKQTSAEHRTWQTQGSVLHPEIMTRAGTESDTELTEPPGCPNSDFYFKKCTR